MANIVQRLVKGSPLTLQEHDDNFNNLNAELALKSTPASVDTQINAAVAIEAAARVSGDNAEVTARNAAIATGDTATLVSAKAYSDSAIATEVTNRNSAVTTAVNTLKGGVAADGDTLGKLRALITGTNTGTNTGDETNATILAKLGATLVTGSNTGDQTNITGNAGTASKLASARTINGVAFDGTANITVNAIDSTARVASSLLGVANGVATLDSSGLVPAGQLPSYVDDVLEAANLAAFPTTGVTGKIYVALDTNKTYRWSGSTYVYITSGAVDSVAGKTGLVTLVKADVGLGNVDNTADTAKPVSTAQATADSNVQAAAATDATTKANAAQAAAIAASAPVAHVGATGTAHGVATTSVAGFLSAADKTKLDGVATGAQANVATNLTLGTQTATTAAISSSTGTGVTLSDASTSLAGLLNATDKVKLNNTTGTNTGDETLATIKTKLGVTTLSGSNTGDETVTTIKTKLGITTLSGSNTGDQTTITGNAGSATVLQTARTINGVSFDGSANITVNAVDSTARVASSLLGVANGVATLGSDGKVPATQLPSYVDDIIEVNTLTSFPATGETGKIYIALDTNKTYRWSGTAYVYITSGAVDSVAGKTGLVTLVKADVGLGNVDNTADSAKPVSTAQATAIAAAQAASAPVAHVGATGTAHGVATTSVAGFLSAADKTKLDGIAAGATASVGTVTAVTGTGAIVSSGGTTPSISIVAATTAVPGTMSAADKTKLDAISGTNTGDQIIPTTLPASDVYTWAKAVVKPSYTAAEVGAIDSTTPLISNFLDFNRVNLGAPTFTNRSIGTKIDLWNLRNASEAGYAIGLEQDTMWFGVGNNTVSDFKWYNGITNTMTLANGGLLTATSFNGITGLSSTTPAANGTAAVGTGVTAARADHVHALQTTITGNAGSATVLQTARTINGVSFNGSANITVNAVDSTARVASSLLGVANGVATLDASGLVPTTQLPSFVDDVLEGANLAAFPATGETGKIYVALDTNKTYRWSGSAYVYITSGAVDSVAGKTGVVTLAKADVGLSLVDNTADASKPVSTAQQTALNLKSNLASPTFTGVPAAPTAAVNTNTTQIATTAFVQAEIASDAAPIAHVGSGAAAHAAATTSVNGFMSAADKTKLDGVATSANNYVHPTGDGSSHIPATSTTSAGKVLVAGATANSFAWTTLDMTYLPDAAFKKSVRVATTVNIGSSFAAGVITGPMEVLTIDGIAVALNDRVLVKNQTATLQNGIYYVSTLGTASVAWVLTRTAGANTSSEIAGALVNVDSGTQGGYLYDTDFKSTDTINTAGITWNRVVDTGFAGTVVGSTPGTAAAGISLYYARQDHVHPVQTTITGNAATATKLATARTINGVSFDGTANITITDDTKAVLASPTFTGVPAAPTAAVGTNTTQLATTAFVNAEIANDAPSKTGTGASGTWAIAVTGNAATATTLATARTINGVSFNGSANITVPAASLTGAAVVNGTDGWFRSSGACGWYSTDFAVGIYATEASNVRTYNNANFIAGGNVTAYSDERLKKDWAVLPQDFVLKFSELKHGTYTRIDTEARQVGVSAQELQKVLPEAVMGSGEGDDYLSVAYGNAALVAAVELSKEVVALKATIAAQEERLQKLEALLDK